MQKIVKNPDNIPPHSVESEQALLGCVLLNPQFAIGEVLSLIPGLNDIFYDLRHEKILHSAMKLFNAGKVVDIISVSEDLKTSGQLEGIGGMVYLSSLPELTPSAHNIKTYLDTLLAKRLLRKAIRACSIITSLATQDQDVVQVKQEAEKQLLAITQDSSDFDDDPPLSDTVNQCLDYFDELYHHGKQMGISTGFPDLDQKIGGLKPGEVFVIAGRPSLGKTSIAMTIAENVAVQNGIPALVFSVEMAKSKLIFRMMCSMARVNEELYIKRRATQSDVDRTIIASGKISKSPLKINDRNPISIFQLRSIARRMFKKHGIRLIVVDYLQLMQVVKGSNESREREVADLSNGIKQIAKELNIPVIALAQLNREIDREKERKPRFSDLRESGAIEQDADVVGMLYKPGDEESDAEVIGVNMLIAKNRNGPTGDVKFTFVRKFFRYESAVKYQPEHAVSAPYADD